MKAFPPPRAIGVYDPGLRATSLADGSAHLYRASARRLGVASSTRRVAFGNPVLPQVHRRDCLWPGRAAHHLAPRRWRACLRRTARQSRSTRRLARASRALCADDRDAGQRLSDFDGQRLPASLVRAVHPAELVAKDKSLAEATGWAHYVFAWTIAFVLAAHLGAVVWHAAIKRDTILTRMWPGYRPAAPIAKS